MGQTTKLDHHHDASMARQRQGAQAVEREITGGEGQANSMGSINRGFILAVKLAFPVIVSR
jgi:hypothetical protein